MESTFSGKDLEAVLPESLRVFVAIDSLPLPPRIFGIVSEALRIAAEAIAPAARVRRRCYMVFATPPFRLNTELGELRYTPTTDLIHVTLEDTIFIDVNKLIDLPGPYRVVTILEELVHALLSVDDEDLAMIVAAYLYPGIRLVDGRYTIPPETSED